MKRILLISDSHDHPNLVKRLADQYRDSVDLMVHCGDVCAPVETVRDFITVQGNCDAWNAFPRERIISCEKHRILILHGSSVFSNWARFSPETMARYAREKECTVVMFGHSHQYYDGEYDGVRLLNPGSLTGGHVNDDQPKSYMIVEMNGVEIRVEKHTDLPFVIG